MIKYIYVFWIILHFFINIIIMENSKSTPLDIYQSEASVKEVQATMHMEGFNLTDDELSILNDCILGKKNSEEIRRELIARIIYRKNNA